VSERTGVSVVGLWQWWVRSPAKIGNAAIMSFDGLRKEFEDC